MLPLKQLATVAKAIIINLSSRVTTHVPATKCSSSIQTEICSTTFGRIFQQRNFGWTRSLGCSKVPRCWVVNRESSHIMLAIMSICMYSILDNWSWFIAQISRTSSFLITGMMKKQLAIEFGEFLTTGYVLLYLLIKLHDHPPMPKYEHSLRSECEEHAMFFDCKREIKHRPKRSMYGIVTFDLLWKIYVYIYI